MLLDTSRKRSTILTFGLFLGACTATAATALIATVDDKDSTVHIRQIETPLAMPTLVLPDPEDDAKERFFMSTSISNKDTFSEILQRLNVEDHEAFVFLAKSTEVKNMMRLGTGKQVVAEVEADGELVNLESTYADEAGSVHSFKVVKKNKSFRVIQTGNLLNRQVEMRSGRIGSSFFVATDAADTPAVIASKMADIFGTQLDFPRDVKKGDHFNVVYETFWRNGVQVKTGNILAAEINASGNSHKVVLFALPGQAAAYYTPDGIAVKNSFLKSPLTFSRMSSGFAMRTHPISGDWRQHKGVDFTAPTGTPIHATSSGVVEFAGTQNGYGNMVKIGHSNKVTTVYGHLQRFATGLHNGEHVKQGQVIGFVGVSGWATGPHVHYEFRVNNEPHNPQLASNTLETINKQNIPHFLQVSSDMTHRLSLMGRI
jgi:murein DD-endopeptidase MepM/ murein hydrolase activator NlpD